MRKIKMTINFIIVVTILLLINFSIEFWDPLFYTVLSESEYEKLNIGMTYNQVTDIVGGEGHRTYSDLSENGVREVYYYTAPNSINNMGHGDIYITFFNKKLISIKLEGRF